MDNNDVAYELAKKYTFEKFNFETGTPEELLALFQETEATISDILTNQTKELHKKIMNKFLESDVKTVTI